MIAPADILPGDIVVVGPRVTSRKLRWGKHICIAERIGDGHVKTIEGNAHGTLPGSAYGEGVVRQVRPLSSSVDKEYRVLYGVRPLPGDFDGR